uniref:Uncharacterized protein n=1 Tax=Rhizophora mucronata TaxID=61149 RepID=A0A2P2II52_RHIMU
MKFEGLRHSDVWKVGLELQMGIYSKFWWKAILFLLKSTNSEMPAASELEN